jgi:hypothetical protein
MELRFKLLSMGQVVIHANMTMLDAAIEQDADIECWNESMLVEWTGAKHETEIALKTFIDEI